MTPIQFSIAEKEQIRIRLQSIADIPPHAGRKYAWIRSDLSLKVASAWQRILWCILPRCFREWAFGTNSKKSQDSFRHIRQVVSDSASELIPLFNKATEAFNRILKPKIAILSLPERVPGSPVSSPIEKEELIVARLASPKEEIVEVLPTENQGPGMEIARHIRSLSKEAHSLLLAPPPVPNSVPPAPPGVGINEGVDLNNEPFSLIVDRYSVTTRQKINNVPPPPRVFTLYQDGKDVAVTAIFEGKVTRSVAGSLDKRLKAFFQKEVDNKRDLSRTELVKKAFEKLSKEPKNFEGLEGAVLICIDKVEGHLVSLTYGNAVEAKVYIPDREGSLESFQLSEKEERGIFCIREQEFKKNTLLVIGSRDIWKYRSQTREEDAEAIFMKNCLQPLWKTKASLSLKISRHVLNCAEAQRERPEIAVLTVRSDS